MNPLWELTVRFKESYFKYKGSFLKDPSGQMFFIGLTRFLFFLLSFCAVGFVIWLTGEFKIKFLIAEITFNLIENWKPLSFVGWWWSVGHNGSWYSWMWDSILSLDITVCAFWESGKFWSRQPLKHSLPSLFSFRRRETVFWSLHLGSKIKCF